MREEKGSQRSALQPSHGFHSGHVTFSVYKASFLKEEGRKKKSSVAPGVMMKSRSRNDLMSSLILSAPLHSAKVDEEGYNRIMITIACMRRGQKDDK